MCICEIFYRIELVLLSSKCFVVIGSVFEDLILKSDVFGVKGMGMVRFFIEIFCYWRCFGKSGFFKWNLDL